MPTRPGEFEESGLRFRYPESWSLDREDADNGWTATVQSPGTAFLTVTLDTDSPDPQYMADQVLRALRSEYPALEADEVVGSLAGQPAVGHDVQFFQFDLTNTCWTRAFSVHGGTVLVLAQLSDIDRDPQEAVLQAICASIRVDE
jgi:hypothetical protein